MSNVPNPVFLTYDSANGHIYAANHDTQVVSVIDTSTNNVISTINVGPDPQALDLTKIMVLSMWAIRVQTMFH